MIEIPQAAATEGGEPEPIWARYEPNLSGNEPSLGDKVRFVPAANLDHSAGFTDILREKLEGTVIQIHREHRWYRVEYVMPRSGCIGRECFKF